MSGDKVEKDILVTNSNFWKKDFDSDVKSKNFMESFKRIKSKKDLNLIDEMLLDLLDSLNYR